MFISCFTGGRLDSFLLTANTNDAEMNILGHVF